MCEWFAGKMYCRYCGEKFYFDRECHTDECPHTIKRKREELEARVKALEEEI